MSEFFQAGMGPSTKRDENAFTTYADLGEHIKRQNLSITLSDEQVGRWAAQKFDYTVLEQTAGQILEPAAKIADAVSGFSRDVLRTGTDISRQSGSGIVSGASLGLGGVLSKTIDPEGASRDQASFAYGAGELAGEVAGPYRTVAGLFGNTIRRGRGVVPRMVAGGTEAAVVEGGKASLQQEGDVISATWDGFLMGGLSEGVIGGAMKGGRKGLEWLIQPRKGEELATETIEWYASRGMPVPPTVARPYSNTMALMQQKASRSAAAMSIVKNIRGELAEGLTKAKTDFINAVGENAALKPPLEAGRALYDRVTDVSKFLREKMREHYKGVAESEVGSKVYIDPNMKFTPVRDGVPAEEPLDLWGIFRGALGTYADKYPKNQPAPLRALHDLFQEAREKHTMQTRTVRGETAPGPMVHLRPGADDFQTIYQTESGPASQWSREEEFLPRQDYNYWWGVIKEIGNLMDTTQYKKNATVRRHVLEAYHGLQNAIDYQAIKFNPGFEGRITHAREAAKLSFEYDDLPMVNKVLAAPDDFRSEEMIDVLFRNTESVQATKRMLGPDDYDIARQAWLRTVLNRTLDIGEEVLEDRPRFRKLWQEISKKSGLGMDSQFIDEVFNEKNFVAMYSGKPLLNVTTAGAEKRELMQEFWDQFRSVDSMMSQLHGGAEDFGGAGLERGGLGSFVNVDAIAASFGTMKRLAFQLLATTRLGKEYFKRNPEDNYFIFKKIPEWEGGIDLPEFVQQKMRDYIPGASGGPTAFPSQFPGIPSQISSSTRQAATSAALNRILPSD